MQEASLLETTAEVSVAFAGFIGIFLVLAAREGRFAAGDAFVIRLIVLCSVGPVFFAALPLIIHAFGLAGAPLWRLSSAAAGLAGGAGVSYMALQLRGLAPGEGRALNYGAALGCAAALSCLANVVGWPFAPTGAMYLVTLWSVVGIAGGNFVELLFRKLL